MNYCIAGKNNIAVYGVNYLVNDLEVSVDDLFIIPNKNDSGENGWQLSLKKYALENNIKIINLQDIYLVEDLIFLSLEFDKIIKPEKFLTKNLFNIHFSLLPKYKGMYTSVWPILNGERESGVTLHKIDKGIDTGDIIDQIRFEIDINDTVRDLYFKYLENSVDLFKKNIKNLINNTYSVKPQPAIFSSYYSKDSIDFTNIKIDFNKTSFEIHNQIRAFIFREYQLPLIISNKRAYKSIFTNEKWKIKQFEIKDREILISGIDGYLIKVLVEND